MTGLRARSFAVLTVLLVATIAQGQWVADSLDASRFVNDMVYNSRYGYVLGVAAPSREGVVFAIQCTRGHITSAVALDYPGSLAFDSTDNKLYCPFGWSEDSLVALHGYGVGRIATIPLDGATWPPWDPANNRLYVSCSPDNVAVIDCSADTLIARIPVGGDPVRMYINTRQRKLYVLNWEDESITVVDLQTLQPLATLPVPSGAQVGCYAEVVDKFYCDSWSGIVVIDGQGDSLVAEIDIPLAPPRRLISIDEGRTVIAAVTNVGGDSVYFVDTSLDSVVATLGVGGSPNALAWNPVSGLVYCVNTGSDDVTVVTEDGSQVVTTLAVGDAPRTIVVAPDYGKVYVGHANSRYIYVIRDTASAVAEWPERTKPACPAATLIRGRLTATEPGRLYDTGGRQVCLLQRGENDVRHLAPGVYTAHLVTGALSRVVKVR